MQHSDRLQDAIELTQALIRIPSANPPGNEQEIASFVRNWLLKRGVRSQFVELEPGRSSLIARIPGSETGSVVLCGHLDTVVADEDAWSIPPFEARIENGRLAGLGAADMKSGVAVLMQAVAWLVQEHVTPSQDIVLALTADEEWGYRGAKTIAESGFIDDAELLLIAEPTEGRVHAGQKGELWIEASFAGKAAHGSMPEMGISSILPAAKFALEVQQAIDLLQASSAGDKISINIGRFDGGQQVNIVPDRTRVQLDLRVAEPAHYEIVVQTIQRIGKSCTTNGCRFSHRVISYHPPILCALDHPFATALRNAVLAEIGPERQLPMTPYSTDAVSIVPLLNVPVLIWGPGSIAQAHQPNEYIELAAIEQALGMLTRALVGF